MKFDVDYIEQLAKIVAEQGLSEICLEEGEQAIVVKKEKEVIAASVQAAPVAVQAQQPVASQVQATSNDVEAPAEVKNGTPITAPMVGTFYSAPSPESDDFVKVGQSVKTGDVVCIIEAMKLMNELESEVSGKVLEICVENGEPVEFGQVLMYVG